MFTPINVHKRKVRHACPTPQETISPFRCQPCLAEPVVFCATSPMARRAGVMERLRPAFHPNNLPTLAGFSISTPAMYAEVFRDSRTPRESRLT